MSKLNYYGVVAIVCIFVSVFFVNTASYYDDGSQVPPHQIAGPSLPDDSDVLQRVLVSSNHFTENRGQVGAGRVDARSVVGGADHRPAIDPGMGSLGGLARARTSVLEGLDEAREVITQDPP